MLLVLPHIAGRHGLRRERFMGASLEL